MDLFGRKRIAALLEELSTTQAELAEARRDIKYLDKLRASLVPLTEALGRIIAQKELYFVLDELDPKRRAESDALGEKAIARLKAEHAARNRF